MPIKTGNAHQNPTDNTPLTSLRMRLQQDTRNWAGFAPWKVPNGRFIGRWWDSPWGSHVPPPQHTPPSTPTTTPTPILTPTTTLSPNQRSVDVITWIMLSLNPKESQIMREIAPGTGEEIDQGNRSLHGSIGMKVAALEFAELLDKISSRAFRMMINESNGERDDRQKHIDFSERLSGIGREQIATLQSRLEERRGSNSQISLWIRELTELQLSLEASNGRRDAYFTPKERLKRRN